jgi:hypothetical protein
MKKLFKRTVSVCAVVLVLAFGAYAQNSKNEVKSNQSGTSAASIPGKVAVIVVGTAAKVAWATTKFVAKDVAGPIAKTVFLKAAPKLTLYVLKKSPKIAAKLAPRALKLALL